jgi:hypothetical protein
VRLRITLRAKGAASVGVPQAAQVCAQDLLDICISEEKRWKQGHFRLFDWSGPHVRRLNGERWMELGRNGTKVKKV